ncbi:MAG: SPOR domain-containing protein, partial [Pseudomonadota bacterium]
RTIDADGATQVIYARGLDQAPQDFGLSRSLALSFGVTEDYATAVELLRPFSNDAERLTSARRALSYIYALSGQQDAAETVLASVSTEEELAVSRPFLNRLAELSNKDQAFAVFLDRLPPTQTNEFAKPLPESVPVSNVPKTEPVASSPETRIKPDTASLPQADQWGSHGVQIAAYRQLDKLEIGAQRLATQSSLFDPTDLAVETVQTDENGSLYRLILHGFDGFDAATAQCARIKQSGADCSIRALAGRRLRRLDDVVGTAD